MKIDVEILKDFLNSNGCGLYFKRDPFIIAGNFAKVNDIEDSVLTKWAEEFNSRHGGEAPSADDDQNSPAQG